MPAPEAPLSVADFAGDPHAARYRGALESNPTASRRLFELLNDPRNEQRLVDAELHDLPALAGVVRYLEADPDVGGLLSTGKASYRFRQAVGVAVKLKMAKLGWRTTGSKGTVKGATHFSKAERYRPDPSADRPYADRALSALRAIREIGDEDERDETVELVMTALAEARERDGRAF
jgi:hypothetical protein